MSNADAVLAERLKALTLDQKSAPVSSLTFCSNDSDASRSDRTASTPTTCRIRRSTR